MQHIYICKMGVNGTPIPQTTNSIPMLVSIMLSSTYFVMMLHNIFF